MLPFAYPLPITTTTTTDLPFINSSDLKLKSYVVEMAKKKGIKVDLDKLEPKYKPCQSPQLNENCTIMIPDVAIVL